MQPPLTLLHRSGSSKAQGRVTPTTPQVLLSLCLLPFRNLEKERAALSAAVLGPRGERAGRRGMKSETRLPPATWSFRNREPTSGECSETARVARSHLMAPRLPRTQHAWLTSSSLPRSQQLVVPECRGSRGPRAEADGKRNQNSVHSRKV